VRERDAVSLAVLLDQLALGDPVHLTVELVLIVLEVHYRVLPHARDLFHHVVIALIDPTQGLLEVLLLHVESAGLSAVGEPDPPFAGGVVADLADRPDRILEGHVPDLYSFFEHA
jgi:hypothetical protein